MKRVLFIMVAIFVSAGFIFASGQGESAEAGASSNISEIAIATASVGGAWYPIGAGMAEVINKNIEGLNARVQTTGGGVENVKLVNDGDTEIGITISHLAYKGYNAQPPFPKEFRNISLLCSGLSKGVLQIAVLDDSSIKGFADLKGKKLAVGPAGGGALAILEILFDEYGYSFDDITASYVSYDEGISQMTDRQVDAAIVYAAVPTPAIKTLEAGTHKFRLLTLEENILDDLMEKYPYLININILKSTYGLSYDVSVVGTQNLIIVNSDMPEDVVYNITKAFFSADGLTQIRDSHPSAKGLSLGGAVENPIIPIHPGALKFYKEMGLLR